MENKNDMFNKAPKNNKQKMFKFNLYWMYGLIFIMLFALYLTNDSSASKELGWTEFQKLAQENVFDRMVVYNKKNLVEATVKDGQKGLVFRKDSATLGTNPKVYVKIPSADKFSDFYDKSVAENHITTQVSFEEGDDAIWNFLVSFGPILLIIVVWIFLMRRMSGGASGGPGGVFSVGKAKAQLFDKDNDRKVTFKDVAGLAEAKQEVEEIVSFLKNPEKYTELGGKIPKGALLVGPPGTGKTLLAKAVAGEANVPFFSISGSEFVEMFVGMGAAKVRDLFKQANEKAPCIVFIDEIDAVGKKRESGQIGGNDEREQTLNQLLSEMDGFDGSKGVVILAATNRPESLDPALLRPGRFDRRIPVELPDLKGREDILKVHAAKIKIADNVDFNAIARTAAGASGAELANIVNEAALRAVRDGRKFATQTDLMESVEVVIAGYQKKNRILSTKEKLIVSYHEVGHALVAALQTNSAPVQKITIIPRTSGALGFTMQVDEGEKYLMTKEELENKIATFTGGRVAEELVFGDVTTGASNDIEQATKLARAIITRYGMSEFGMVAMESLNNVYLGGDTSMSCSQETAAKIDDLVVALVQKQYEKAKNLLNSHMDKLHEISKFLYEHETITGEEFMEILNRPQIVAQD